MKKPLPILFLLHLTTRLVFILIHGFYNNYALHPDSYWLVDFGDEAAKGNFNFELERFVASPLYPALVGAFKSLFAGHWATALVVFQLLLSSLGGVVIYQTAKLLFRQERIALLASLLFALFPFTLWYTHTFSQECLFEALFIFCFYYLIKSLREGRIGDVALSALFFSGAYLTKSHILLYAPFIALLYWHYFKWTGKMVRFVALYAGISLALSLPYGLYQLRQNGQYVISSNGLGYFFFLANSEAMYRVVADPPAKNSDDYAKIRDIINYVGYYNGSPSHYDSMLALPQKVKQKLWFREGLQWIRDNPKKFAELKAYDAFYFLLPGLNWHYYPRTTWLFSLLVSLPVYFGAYVSLWVMAKKDRLNTLPALYLFLVMFLFSVIFYVQNRFRTITLEPVYVMYAAAYWSDRLGRTIRRPRPQRSDHRPSDHP